MAKKDNTLTDDAALVEAAAENKAEAATFEDAPRDRVNERLDALEAELARVKKTLFGDSA